MKLLFNPTGSSKLPGVLIPIPQYPLYSATLAEFNIHQVTFDMPRCRRNYPCLIHTAAVLVTV